jgi:hypothetical protein
MKPILFERLAQRWGRPRPAALPAEVRPLARLDVDLHSGYYTPDGGYMSPLKLPDGSRGLVHVREGWIDGASIVLDERPVHLALAAPVEFSLLGRSLRCLLPARGRKSSTNPQDVTCEGCLSSWANRGRWARSVTASRRRARGRKS